MNTFGILGGGHPPGKMNLLKGQNLPWDAW